MNYGIKIEDNFLAQNIFDELQALMMGDRLAWYFNDGIDFALEYEDGTTGFPEESDKDKFQFVHIFYSSMAPCSPYFKDLSPILELIQPTSIFRIKSNLLTKTPNIIKNAFHVDMNMPEEKLKQWTTSIFYVNTNNGYTKFEDGTKVESVANRMVTFPSNMKHTGTSCTDKKTRIVINFNYFK